eukprot:196562-Karenia_brevis.AAC.1
MDISVDAGIQYESDMVAEQVPSSSKKPVGETIGGDEKLAKIVAMVIEQVLGKLLPQVQQLQQQSS